MRESHAGRGTRNKNVDRGFEKVGFDTSQRTYSGDGRPPPNRHSPSRLRAHDSRSRYADRRQLNAFGETSRSATSACSRQSSRTGTRTTTPTATPPRRINHKLPPPPPARVADGSPDAGDDVDDARDVDAPADDGERGERGWADRMDEFPDDDGDEYAEADEEDDEDFTTRTTTTSSRTRSTLWIRATISRRGVVTLAVAGGGLATSAWRPNANGGAGNHGRGARLPGGGKSRGGDRVPPRAVAKSSGKDNQTLMQHNSARIDKKIRTGYLHGDFGGGGNVGQRVGNAMRESERKLTKADNLTKDKEDCATVEQALDPRTRLILFKVSHGVFSEINGCISTGKEANVYHAVTAEGVDRGEGVQDVHPRV